MEHYGLEPEPPVLKRAEHSIKAYELEAVTSAEQAFLKAVNRKKERSTLPYFFGILRRIQNERDAAAYQQYCRERYDYQTMLATQRLDHEQAEPKPTVNDFVAMLQQAAVASVEFVKELALRQAQRMAGVLMENCRYLGTLKKQIADALAELRDLSLPEKQRIWELVEQFLTRQPSTESVTLES